MNFAEILAIAVSLAIDALSVAVATSLMLDKVSPRHVFRFAFHFGLFQGLMPVVGWFAGRGIEKYIHAWDHWVAFLLLLAIGVRAIYDSLRDDGSEFRSVDPTRGISLIVLSVATSIDALAVGLNFGLLEVPIVTPAVTIALVTAGLTATGMVLAAYFTSRSRRALQIIGGLVLIGIGAKIFIEHEFA